MFEAGKADVIAKFEHAIAVVHQSAPTAKWADGTSIGLERYYSDLDNALQQMIGTDPRDSLSAWRDWADFAIAEFRIVADILSVLAPPTGSTYYEFYNSEANKIRTAFNDAYLLPHAPVVSHSNTVRAVGGVLVLASVWWFLRK